MNENERFLRLPEVIKLTGYKRAMIYVMIGRGEFPKQRRLGANCVVWLETEIRAWMAERLTALAA